MARSKQTSLKKEKETKKRNKRKEKEEKREFRKANSKKGKSFEDMIAYVDENGQLSSTPPDPKNKVELKLEDIQLGARKHDAVSEVDFINKGRITYFNQAKGYGFIKNSVTKESVFFHLNSVLTPVQESDMVQFEVVKGPKGPNAVEVKKID
jgi:cold shock CspA family protein